MRMSALSAPPQVQRLLDDWRTANGIPGVVLAVAHDDGRVESYASGRADIATGRPMQPDARMRVASISKTFVAADVLKLAEQGKLALDDKLAKYFPTFPNADRIDLRMLLNHTSGVADYINSPEFVDAFAHHPDIGWTHDEPRDVAAKMQPAFAPGTKYQYSNTNYQLLGGVVEQVTGRSLHDNLRADLIAPTDMQHTVLDDGVSDTGLGARGYAVRNGKLHDVTDTVYAPGSLWRTTSWADGAMVTTAADLARWGVQLLGTDKVLSPASRAAMVEGTSSPDRNGLGMFGYPHDSLGHGGGDLGFKSQLIYYPDAKAAVAVIFNSNQRVDREPIAYAAAHPNADDLASSQSGVNT